MVEAVDCGSWVLYIFSSWFVVDKAPSRALGLGAKYRHLPKWIFFNISAAQQYSPFFYIIFHHPDFFTPTASSSDLVFSREDSSVDGAGSHYQLFSLTTTRVRQRCRQQGNTKLHNATQPYGALLFSLLQKRKKFFIWSRQHSSGHNFCRRQLFRQDNTVQLLHGCCVSRFFWSCSKH